MKFFLTFICLIFFSINLSAQTSGEILATANGQSYTAAELPPELREAFEKQNAQISELRKGILAQLAVDILLEMEAAARKISVEKLIDEARVKTAAPTDAEIKAVYDANRDRLGERTLAEVRAQIVAFLRPEAEQKALIAFVTALKTKYKVANGKDVNAPNLKSSDVLVTVGAGKTITVEQFEQKAKPEIYDLQAEIYDAVTETLEEAVFLALINDEARKTGIAASDLIAREVSDKMREGSEDEREKLQDALRQKLFQRYNAKFLLKEPTPFARNISVDDDPSKGAADAPVTVVMFSDFQCPACAATHPVIQKVLAEYGAKVRFVVRDFPLPMHKDAFLAAQAANAAAAQGKFFEYGEILYRNQNALDEAALKKYAADLGLNAQQFELDLQSGKFAGEVRKDIADGNSYGITGTPTIFVNGVKVRRLSGTAFRDAIEKALAKTRIK